MAVIGTNVTTAAESAEAQWHDRQREYAWLMIQWVGCWILLLGIAAAFYFHTSVLVLLLGEDLAAERKSEAKERGAADTTPVPGTSLSPPPTITSSLPIVSDRTSPPPTLLEKN